MNIKNDNLYPIYLEYLNNKNMSKGALDLSKISESGFSDFKIKYETDNIFKKTQDRMYISSLRDNKIRMVLESEKIDI